MAFKFDDLTEETPTGSADPNAPLTPQPAHAAAQQAGGEQLGWFRSVMEGPVAMDAARAIAGGVRDAAQGGIDFLTTLPDPIVLAEKGIRAVTGTSVPEGQETLAKPGAAEQTERVRKALTLPEVEENQYTLGAVTRELVKWGTATAVTRKVAGMPNLTGSASLKAKVLDQAVEGLVTGYIFTDPHAKNLGNLLENVPWLGDVVSDFAGQDDNSPEAVNRLRGALENGVIGSLVAPLMHAIPAVVKYAKLLNAGDEAGALKVMDDAQPKIAEALALARNEPVQLGLYPDVVGHGGTEMRPEAAVRADLKAGDASLTQKVADAGSSAKPADPSVRIFEDTTFNGQRFGNVMEANDGMVVIQKDGKDAGYLRYEKDPKGGFWVRKVEVLPEYRRQGLASQLYDKVESVEGPYRGPHTTLTADGEALHKGRQAKAAAAKLREEVQDAITPGVVDTGKLIDNIKVSRSMGQDGAAFEFEGHINYAKITDDNAVKQMITEVVEAAKENIPNIAGPSYQSAADTLALAERMGKDPQVLLANLRAMGMASKDMAAYIKGGDMLIQRISKELDNDMTGILSGKAELIDLAGFQVKADLLASVMDHVGGLRTEAARATAAGRYKTGLGGVSRENFMKVLEMAGGPDYVLKMAQRLKMVGPDGIPKALMPPKSIFQKAVEIYNYSWVNAVLSGIKTTAVNVFTTGVNTAAMPGMRMLGGIVQELTGAKGGMDQFYQGLYQYRMMRSQLMDSLSMSAKAWRTNGSVLDMAASPLELASRLDPISDTALIQKMGMQWLGTTVGLPSRFLGMQDEFYKQMAYRSHVGAQAWVEGTKQGLEGARLQQYLKDAIAKSVDEQGRGLNEAALLSARQSTFTQSLEAASYSSDRAWMAVANGAASQVPVVKNLMLPFVKVPTNLFRQAWDMTPILNLARKQWVEDVKAGGEAGALALGKMGAGLALWSTAGMLAYEGRITGGGPRDPDLRRQLGPDWQPYSFTWTGSDGKTKYQSFARFDPFSHFFALAADFAEVSGKMKDEEWNEVLGRAGLALMQNISSKTYLRSIADVMDAFTGDDASIEKWVRSRVASHVPNIVQVLQGDDEVKDMRTWFDGFRSRIPGFADPLNIGYSANAVEAKRDNFGEKILPPMGYPYNSVNPFAYHRGTDDPVRLELAALTRTKDEPKFALPHWKQGPADLREIKNPETGQSAYDRWLELHATYKVGGQTLHEAMADLFASPSYQAARARMGEGSKDYKGQALAIEWVNQKFEMYEKLTMIQLQREFKAMGMDIGKAMLQFEIGKIQTKTRGSNAATPVSQLQELAGQR